MEYGKKTENHGKCVIYTLRREIWRENCRRWKIQKCTLYDMEYGKKTENYGN